MIGPRRRLDGDLVVLTMGLGSMGVAAGVTLALGSVTAGAVTVFVSLLGCVIVYALLAPALSWPAGRWRSLIDLLFRLP